MSGSSPQSDSVRRTVHAILGVARGRTQAIGLFGATRQSFIASLIPLAVVPVLNSLISQRHPTLSRLILDLLTSVTALLVPPVVSHALAQLWGREAEWLRFATAFNWCQLGLLVVAMAALFAIATATGPEAAMLVIGVIGIYALWMHWFLARHALVITTKRAVLLVLAVHAATTVMVLIPKVVAVLLRGPVTAP